MRLIPCIIIILLIIAVGALTADKDPILLALLTCASFIRFDKMQLKRFLTLSIIGSACVIIIVLFFDIYRSRLPLGDIINKLTLSSISFTQADPAGPMVSIVDTVNNNFLQLRYGSTYLNSLAVLIPKILWPDRPLDLSEEFARENIAEWSEGQGLGYSPLAEAYVNFSIPGAFIHFFLFGFLLGGLLHILRIWLFFKYEFLLVPFIYILGYYIVIISFRSSLIGPIKMLMMFMMPYCILFIMIKIFFEIVRASRKRSLCYQPER